MRLCVVKRPLRYALSFYGIIDFTSIMPTWASFFVPELAFLIDVRLLRLLRVFRILKLTVYFEEAEILARALANSRRKIFVFLGTVFIITVILGTVMYVVEGPEHGFTSIPLSMYWAIVTLTTTGFGDMVPKTPVGRMLGGVVMVSGICVMALLAGILATGFSEEVKRREFVKVWELVARVPFFADVGAIAISDIVARLRSRNYPAGAVVVRRGGPGDSMFFIVAGEEIGRAHV